MARIFDNKEDDTPDYFDGPDIQQTPKPVKKPKLTPDDPKYWEENESKWEHLRLPDKTKWMLMSGACLIVVVLLLIIYNCYFNPQVEEAVEYGYVEKIEVRGSLFKTYEGVLINYKEITDTTREYTRDFIFSATSEAGKKLQQMQRRCRPVRVEYEIYKTVVPWRGENKIVVTKVDTVSPDSILPPEYRPQINQ